MTSTSPLAIGGHRLAWHEIPSEIRARVTAGVGGEVVAVRNCPGGFSSGMASILTLADGNRVFVKAVSRARNMFAYRAIRRETQVLAGLPEAVPAPRALWSDDDGEWVALATEAVDGHNPAQPWVAEELTRYLTGMHVLAQVLTPSPIEAAHLADAHDFRGWAILAGAPDRAAGLDPLILSNLDRLATLEQPWAAAVAGASLLHGDLRSDNFLLTPDGRFKVVDWPAVCIGAPWLDLLLALPSVQMHGGGDAEQIWLSHPLSHGVDPDAVTTAIVALAGFFLERSVQPPIPNLPTLRAFQLAQGTAAIDWLRVRKVL